MAFTPTTNYSKNKTSGLFADGSDEQRAEYTFALGSGWTPDSYDRDRTSVLLHNGGDEQRAVVTWNLGGSGGGTGDYNDLENKPAIDGVTLTSSTTKADLGLSRVYKYKGSVATYADLANIQNPDEGDVWNVEENDKNYAWTGTAWDDIGGILPVDSALSTTSENPVQNKVVTLQKADKATLTNVSGTTPSVTLANNTIFTATSTLTSLTLALPASNVNDFVCQINFTSGSTPTVIGGAAIKWLGDNASETSFVPRANCRYTIVFYYDGTNYRGMIQGVSL